MIVLELDRPNVLQDSTSKAWCLCEPIGLNTEYYAACAYASQTDEVVVWVGLVLLTRLRQVSEYMETDVLA